MELDRSVFRQTQKSGLRQASPQAFTAAAEGLTRLGQSMQDLGQVGTNLALAEQKLFNDSQFATSQADRKLLIADLEKKLREPATFNPHTFEGDWKLGVAKINADLVKRAPNKILQALIQADGDAYFANNLSTIQKEGRVVRLKALQAQGLNNVKRLRESLVATDDPLLKKGLRETVENVLQGMADNAIIDPSTINEELDSIDKDLEEAGIRRKIATAKTFEELQEVVDSATQLSAEEREIFLAQGERSIRMRREARNAQEDRKHKLAKQEREERYRKNGAAFQDRMNSNNPPSVEELDQAMIRDDISRTVRNQLVSDLTNPPELDRPTDENAYVNVINEIKKLEQGLDGNISEPDIRFHSQLSNADRNNLLQRYRASMSGRETKALTSGEKLMNRIIGDVAAINKFQGAAKKNAAKVLWKEFDDRVNPLQGAGEDPSAVAKELTDRWMNASDPNSPLSRNVSARQFKNLPQEYQAFITEGEGGLQVPDTNAMLAKALEESESGQLPPQEFADLVDQIDEIEEFFPLEAQRKFLPPPPAPEIVPPKKPEQEDEVDLPAAKQGIKETGKELVQPVEQQARELQPLVKEEIREFVEPIKETIKTFKDAVSDSESGPETLNRLATDALNAISDFVSPQSNEQTQSFTSDDLFNTELSANELQNVSDFPDEFILQKILELQQNASPEEAKVLQLLIQEAARRNLTQG